VVEVQRLTDTIPAVLQAAAEGNPDGTWLRTDQGSSTFSAAAGHVGTIAERLRGAGVSRGDLVVVTARTTAAYVLVWLAVTSLGAIEVPTDPRATAAELRGLVAQTRAQHLVTDAELHATVDEALSSLSPRPTVHDVDGLVGDWRAPSPGSTTPATSVDPDDVAVLIPTSGTTGRSKLVMQTHRAYAWAGVGFPWWMELGPDDVMMTSLPLFHINAPAYTVMGSLACGAGLALMPRFSASGFLDFARRHGATEFNAIGAMLEILWRQPPRPDDADHPLRLCYTGPSPAKQWQQAFEERFGLQVVCGYAMSESPYGLIWPRGTRPFGTLGAVRQHPTLGHVNDARVVDERGVELSVGQTGELLLRNPVVTPGYWGMPEVTAETIVDGWLHTGDLVTVEAGALYTFVARKKEVLRRRGQLVSPAEVEAAIASDPSVLEVAVIGVPSELTEEEIKAYVVPVDGAKPDLQSLRKSAAERLTPFKVPRYWEAVEALPRTPTARVAKHRLSKERTPGEWDAEAPTTTTDPQEHR
jgi:carnitine-CoA ligase